MLYISLQHVQILQWGWSQWLTYNK